MMPFSLLFIDKQSNDASYWECKSNILISVSKLQRWGTLKKEKEEEETMKSLNGHYVQMAKS